MICENCSSEHNGSYGSGRFCCEKCARGFSTKANRKEINKKVSEILGGKNYIPREDFCLYCGKVLIKTQKQFCDHSCFANYKHLLFINRWKLGLEKGRKGRLGTSSHIRRYFITKYNNSCQKCGWCETNIYTGSIPVELHHIDGNFLNNTEENLELLCPNCHSLTNTYKSSNKNNTRIYTQKR